MDTRNNNEVEYEVEDIIGFKITTGTSPRTALFIVKWLGFSSEDNTKEPGDNFLLDGKPIRKFTQFLDSSIDKIVEEQEHEGEVYYKVNWKRGLPNSPPQPFSSFQKQSHLRGTIAWAHFKRSQKRKRNDDEIQCDYCGSRTDETYICQSCKNIKLPAIHFYDEETRQRDIKKFMEEGDYVRRHLPTDSYCGIHAIVSVYQQVYPDRNYSVLNVLDHMLGFITPEIINTQERTGIDYNEQQRLLMKIQSSYINRETLREAEYTNDDTFRLCAQILQVCIAIWVLNSTMVVDQTWVVYFPGDCTLPQLTTNQRGVTICDGKPTFFFESLRTYTGHLHWNLLSPIGQTNEDELWSQVPKEDFFDIDDPRDLVRRDRVVNWAVMQPGLPSIGFSTDSLFDVLLNGKNVPEHPISRTPLFGNIDDAEFEREIAKINFTRRQQHLLHVKFFKKQLIDDSLLAVLEENWQHIVELFNYLCYLYNYKPIQAQCGNMPTVLEVFTRKVSFMKNKIETMLNQIALVTKDQLNQIYNPFCNVSLLDFKNFPDHEEEILKFFFMLTRYGVRAYSASPRNFHGLLFNLESAIPEYLRTIRNHNSRRYTTSFFPVFDFSSHCMFKRVLLLHYEVNPSADIPIIQMGVFLSIQNSFVAEPMDELDEEDSLDPFLNVDITLHRELIGTLAFSIPRIFDNIGNYTHIGEQLPILDGMNQLERIQRGSQNRQTDNTRQASIVNFLFYYILLHWKFGQHLYL